MKLVMGGLGKGMSMMESLVGIQNWLKEIQRCDKMEDFYNKNHNQEHYVLRNGRIWLKGNGEGKYWDYLGSSREAQREAHEILRV